jgi:hypothetical protein
MATRKQRTGDAVADVFGDGKKRTAPLSASKVRAALQEIGADERSFAEAYLRSGRQRRVSTLHREAVAQFMKDRDLAAFMSRVRIASKASARTLIARVLEAGEEG